MSSSTPGGQNSSQDSPTSASSLVQPSNNDSDAPSGPLCLPLSSLQHLIVSLNGRITSTLALLKPAIPVIFLGQPARLSESIPANSEDPGTWAEAFWTSRIKEAKMMVQVIGILLAGVVTRLYTSEGSRSLEDALLHLSFTMFAMSLIMQSIVTFYSNAMQIPGSNRHQWAEAAHARTLVAFASINPWVVLSMPTVWTLWGIVIVCITILVSAWRPSSTTNVPTQPVGSALAVTMTGVLILGAFCSLELIATCHRWTRLRISSGRNNYTTA